MKYLKIKGVSFDTKIHLYSVLALLCDTGLGLFIMALAVSSIGLGLFMIAASQGWLLVAPPLPPWYQTLFRVQLLASNLIIIILAGYSAVYIYLSLRKWTLARGRRSQ